MKKPVLIASILFPLASWAAENHTPLDVKLGLWETTINNQTSGMPPVPDEVLSRLTPEQRARMEAAMRARHGGHSSTSKSCLTKERLNNALGFDDKNNENCRRSLVTSSATAQDYHIDCAYENIRTTGQVHVEALDPEHVKGEGHVKSTNGPRTMDINLSFNSKWLSSDCGSVK